MSLGNTLDGRLYRVYVDPNKNTAKVSCIGINSVDAPTKQHYASVDDLPKWVQKRLVILMMLDPKTAHEMGKQVDQYTFWIKGEDISICSAIYDDGKEDYVWQVDKME